jgi:hypothetical protein
MTCGKVKINGVILLFNYQDNYFSIEAAVIAVVVVTFLRLRRRRNR